MHAFFRFEISVGILADHLESHALYACLVTCKLVHFDYFIAHALCISSIHSIQHASPILRFRSACACVEREYCVVDVILAFEQSLQSQSLYVLRKFAEFVHDLLHLLFAAVAHLGEFDKHLQILALRKQLVKVLYLALYSRQLPIYLLGVVHIVPKSVLGLLLFKLFGF